MSRVTIALRGRVLTPLAAGGVQLIEDGVVVVSGPTLAAVWPYRKARRALSIPIRDVRPGIITPGFVDTHLHFPQTEIIGRATGPLLDWLNTSVFPEEARFARRSHARRVASLFIERMLKAGTTTASVFSSSSADATGVLFRALSQSGMRAAVGLTLMDARTPPALKVPRREAMASSRKLANRWDGHDGRLRFSVTPRFALSCTRAMLNDAGKLARELGLPVQTHIAETPREGEETLAVHKYASSYVDVYDRAGLLTERTILAHGIHLSRSELSVLRKRACHIAHCPDSNFFLGSGRMPVAKTLRHGVNVALGTDVAAGRTFSMRRAMASAYDTALSLGAPLPLSELFRMATIAGARALGVADRIGTLEAGKDADFVIVPCPSSVNGADALLQHLVFDTDSPAVDQAYVRGRRLNLTPGKATH